MSKDMQTWYDAKDPLSAQPIADLVPSGLHDDEYIELALLCLDQAGIEVAMLNAVERMINAYRGRAR